MKPTLLAAAGLLAGFAIAAAAAPAQDADLGALELVAEPVRPVDEKSSPIKLYVEGAVGVADPRFEEGSQSLGRISLDLLYTARLAPTWRAVFSDRVDIVEPVQRGTDRTVNSLRELYVAWDAAEQETTVDLGRINWRQGPAYGYNPTDFFRDGSLRVVTTADPLAWRQNRLGVVMLRGRQAWQGGSAAIALAPKLEDAPSSHGLSADLGATNNRDRALVTVDQQLSQRFSGQLLFYKDEGLDLGVGANFSALVSNAIVGYGEWTHTREPTLLDRALGRTQSVVSGNRFTGGLTYTTAGRLSLTAEVQYNRFALDKAEWDRVAVAGGMPVLGAYLTEAQRRQDLATRRGYMLYVSQPGAWLKGLDLTAFVRVDGEDRSTMTWVEARYHWDTVDAALQWQHARGPALSQHGLNPYRQAVQLVVSYHFR